MGKVLMRPGGGATDLDLVDVSPSDVVRRIWIEKENHKSDQCQIYPLEEL